MKIRVLGAAGGEVTGSAYHVQSRRANVLIDCGMFQGGKESEAKNKLPQGVRLDKLDAILLTHAHLDHTGRVPLLIKHGYTGPIYATSGTVDLAQIILKDAAKLQSQDAERTNRKRERAGKPPVEPLYEPEHAEPFVGMTRPVEFREPVRVAEGMTARYFEAGHMLGSASIELTVEEDGQRRVLVFSGDLGPTTMPILREFERLSQADVVFLESTYGDRDHRRYSETVDEFESIIKEVVAKRGKALIPTFAIGRSQQMLYHLAVMFLQKKVKPFPVHLDSPMAIEASAAFVRHPDLFDEEMNAWRNRGLLTLHQEYLHNSVTADDSRKLNSAAGPCAILAGSGMCTAGRILHHFKQNLWKPDTHVLIVGYQGYGSLGRRLVEGAHSISIFGEKVIVRATVHTLNGFSAHAGQSELLTWFSSLAPCRPKVFLTHGEDGPRQTLAKLIQQRHKLKPTLPALGETIEL